VIEPDGCKRLIETFTQVLESPEHGEDGWSEWMEQQIRDSLSAKMREYKSTASQVKCSDEGCVFVVYSQSRAEMFDTAWQPWTEFEQWLRKQTWNEWLDVKAASNGDKSTVAWRVVGFLDERPFITWYIVTRRQ
jgi:hypothetical protein